MHNNKANQNRSWGSNCGGLALWLHVMPTVSAARTISRRALCTFIK